MVTKTIVGTSYTATGAVDQLYDYRCLSTDEKPTDAAVNALLLETDTGDFYAFGGEQWSKVGA